MNRTKHIACEAYKIYMEKSHQQLSPYDALWYTDLYLTENPNVSDEEAIQFLSNAMIQDD